MNHEHNDTHTATKYGEEFWEEFYRDRPQIWTGNPNALLVREVSDLTPGTALDLGCGEGGDAIWLAERGWKVTAVDVSPTAIERGKTRAAGLDITWAAHDLQHDFPEGTFDLVSAQFLHSPNERPNERAEILRRASQAVAVAGRLVIGSHFGMPSWATHRHDMDLPSISQTLEQLALGPNWHVEMAELIFAEAVSPEGEVGERSDSVLRIRRDS
ncbi:class I SAM-dependent methyltransferase [Nocardia camponoti]|uniref:Methyltransferase n=1 Tax=Nocardia camponoti TaxID=1616106 RepID=A0A917QI66_9NOCA|nr:class I SAM-dependent methyltransferase [Nocardia camponoti]GGK51950.1 methyltransferase [Nocardia camponoti]